MYVIFEQRQPGLPGSAFTDGAWDRFFQGLDSILGPGGPADSEAIDEAEARAEPGAA